MIIAGIKNVTGVLHQFLTHQFYKLPLSFEIDVELPKLLVFSISCKLL